MMAPKRNFRLPDHRSRQQAKKTVGRPPLPLPPLLAKGITRVEAIDRERCGWEGGKITAVDLHRRSCCGRRIYRLGFCKEHYARVCEGTIRADSLLSRAR